MTRRVCLGRLAAFALCFAVLALAGSAEAQPARSPYRVVILSNESSPALDGLRQGLRDLGYVEGRDITLEYVWAGTRSDRFPALAAEIVRKKADFIFTWGTPATLAAKKATTTIPIVMGAVGDPLSVGIVTSLGHPGGNITGLSSMALDLEEKRLELLKQLAPQLKRVAVLWQSGNPALQVSSRMASAAAQKLDLKLVFVSLTEAPTLEGALDLLGRQKPDGLAVMAEPALLSQVGKITAFAKQRRLPAVYPYPEYARAGGVLTYATSYYDLFRRAATYIDRIIKGAKPGDLPIEQPTKFELIINLGTARALGLTVPPSLLVRADSVIE